MKHAFSIEVVGNLTSCWGPSRSTTCYVYFILAPSMRRIKIGFSFNLKSRLKDLQLGSPDQLTVLTCLLIQCLDTDESEPQWFYESILRHKALEIESHLHEKFKHIRVKGEWFEATDELLSFVDEIKETVLV
jgi:hypothetical protein